MTPAVIAAACGFLFSPPPAYDALSLPAGAVVREVPATQLDSLCEGHTPHLRAGLRMGCAFGLTAYVPTWTTWSGTRECWIENRRHEMAHLKGWVHP